MLEIDKIGFAFGGRTLFDETSAVIPQGHRVGLVGRNGSGKTTLFNLIARDLELSGGEIRIRRGHRVGRLAQEAPSGPESLIDTVLAADEERSRLMARAETESDPTALADIHTRLHDIGASRAPARAARILSGLGFTEDEQRQSCGSLSGGWRMRVALAAILFTEPDILLLDEPTNYLDLEGVVWLERFLKAYPRTVIIISHDRDLLNRAVNHILHLDGGKLTLYGGGYDRFEEVRAQHLAHSQAMSKRQEAQRAHMQTYIDRFRAQANKARQAQSRLKALARMKPIAAMIEERVAPLPFDDPAPLSPPIIRITGGITGYDRDQPVLSGLDIRVDPDDRIAVLGRNGNGKSTLAKLLAGVLPLFAGERVQSPRLKPGFFTQHQVDALHLADSAVAHLARQKPDLTPARVRAILGARGFGAERADTPVEKLSGGEKARLLLTLISVEKPHLLILDEPTNHLDIDSREALVHALNDYRGAVILISHDIHLVETVADRLWLVDKGGVEAFDGDLDDYRKFILQPADKAASSKVRPAGLNRKEQRREAARKRQENTTLRQAVKAAESTMERLGAEIEKLDARLADPALYQDDPVKFTNLTRQKSQVDKKLREAEARWLAAQEKVEAEIAG